MSARTTWESATARSATDSQIASMRAIIENNVRFILRSV